MEHPHHLLAYPVYLLASAWITIGKRNPTLGHRGGIHVRGGHGGARLGVHGGRHHGCGYLERETAGHHASPPAAGAEL